MDVDVYDIFYYCCLLLSAIGGLFFYKRADPAFKWLSVLILLTLVSEATAKYISYGLYIDNGIVYHFFTPIEYAIYLAIFYYLLNLKKWNTALWLSGIGLLLFEIANTILFQPLQVANTNTMRAECVLLVILSLALFLKIRQNPSQQNLLKDGAFWFNSAVLCYYSYNVLNQGFHKMQVYLLDNPPQIIYDFNMVLSGILYLTYVIAIYLNATSRT